MASAPPGNPGTYGLNRGGGASSFAELSGSPASNSALAAALAARLATRADIVGLTGGGATALDSIETADLADDGSVGVIINVTGVGGQTWVLLAGTDAEDAAGGIVRPDDYAASTNEKIWVRIA